MNSIDRERKKEEKWSHNILFAREERKERDTKLLTFNGIIFLTAVDYNFFQESFRFWVCMSFMQKAIKKWKRGRTTSLQVLFSLLCSFEVLNEIFQEMNIGVWWKSKRTTINWAVNIVIRIDVAHRITFILTAHSSAVLSFVFFWNLCSLLHVNMSYNHI